MALGAELLHMNVSSLKKCLSTKLVDKHFLGGENRVATSIPCDGLAVAAAVGKAYTTV